MNPMIIDSNWIVKKQPFVWQLLTVVWLLGYVIKYVKLMLNAWCIKDSEVLVICLYKIAHKSQLVVKKFYVAQTVTCKHLKNLEGRNESNLSIQIW